MKTTLILTLSLSLLLGCKSKTNTEESTSSAPVIAEPAIDFVGQCINETAGTPYHSIFFYPKFGEMFLYKGDSGAARVPLHVTDESPRKVDFSLRWMDDKESTTTDVGSVVASGKKWSFSFQLIKSSVCRPTPAPFYTKVLPELGILPGKWRGIGNQLELTIAADVQAMRIKFKGSEALHRYRVLEHTDNVVVIVTDTLGVNNTDPAVWQRHQFTMHDGILVHEFGTEPIVVKYQHVANTQAPP